MNLDSTPAMFFDRTRHEVVEFVDYASD